MAGAWMEAAGEEDAEDEVEERFLLPQRVNVHVKCDLRRPVHQVRARDVLRLDEHGPQRVGQDLAAAPDGFGERATDELALEPRRDVRVDAVDALVLVVLEVVAPEGHAVGDADRKVGDHRKIAVGLRTLEEEVVRELMDRQEERLRDRRTDDVRDREVRWPRELLRRPREPNLRDDEQKEADVLGFPLGTHELGHLRVRLLDLLAPRRMWLLLVVPKEVVTGLQRLRLCWRRLVRLPRRRG